MQMMSLLQRTTRKESRIFVSRAAEKTTIEERWGIFDMKQCTAEASENEAFRFLPFQDGQTIIALG